MVAVQGVGVWGRTGVIFDHAHPGLQGGGGEGHRVGNCFSARDEIFELDAGALLAILVAFVTRRGSRKGVVPKCRVTGCCDPGRTASSGPPDPATSCPALASPLALVFVWSELIKLYKD